MTIVAFRDLVKGDKYEVVDSGFSRSLSDGDIVEYICDTAYVGAGVLKDIHGVTRECNLMGGNSVILKKHTGVVDENG